jgi:hypothetical protein
MKFRNIFILILITGFILGQNNKSCKAKKTKVAFYYSLIPGLGQIYNGKWIKSAMFIGLEIASIDAWSKNKSIYNKFENGDYPLRKNRYLEKRNKYAWWIGFIYVYAMIDAIVDAHLYPFDSIMESPIESEKKRINKHED